MKRLPLALRPVAALLIAAILPACSDAESPPEDRVAEGQRLFKGRGLSDSSQNRYSCKTCHDSDRPDLSRKKPGAALAGVTLRATYWGGQENDLLRSVNACRRYFMFASSDLRATEPNAESLYAYLLSLEPGNSEPVPFTVVRTVENLPRGDEASGQVLFTLTCSQCHGTLHEGVGRLRNTVPVLPEDTLNDHVDYSPREQRLVFIEKTRHGLFLGYGGDMPPFSTEVLSDAELSDILEALGAVGE
jgi:thiosulfate dehydrogenase